MGTGVRILAVPACRPGLGGGHLIRCINLVNDLRALGKDAVLFIGDSAGNTSVRGILADRNFNSEWLADQSDIQSYNPDIIILDRFRTPVEEYLRWRKLGTVIAIDEGGPCRKYLDFLIDILPGIYPAKPNIADPSLLPLPKEFRPKNADFSNPTKVLISFGQEDPAGLGFAVANAIAQEAAKTGKVLNINFLQGGLGKTDGEHGIGIPGIRIIKTIANLSEHLGQYDLVITHFGLTAFEALYAGVPVLLLSPTLHHEKTARQAGFYSLGTGKGRAKKTAKLLLADDAAKRAFLSMLKNRCIALAKKHNVDHAPARSLADLVSGFEPDVSRNCPVCGAVCDPMLPPLARFPRRTYRQCKYCGIINMDRLTPPPIEYGRDYFFDFYKKQYGKTYIEDFANLKAAGKQRLAVIKKTGAWENAGDKEPYIPALLDIGCAYGPFLQAAKEEGFDPCGIDPAEDAVQYVTQTLGIQAFQGFFPCKTGEKEQKYDAVTLWYVIEHFRSCTEVLTQIQKILKPGGVLAFATPSFSGISGRSRKTRFLEQSPEDHWTVWSPASCKKALALTGFKVKKIKVTGHHPERFPLLGKYAKNKKSPAGRILMAASKVFALGDTFEVYAVRESVVCTPRIQSGKTCLRQTTI